MTTYRRIGEDIRLRIERGELAPGDRVPSTRELAREWKVAMATAAHALRALAEEGVVRAVPRVGTVVASGRERATARRETAARDAEVTRARIVDAAIEVADREGLGALSLRAVSARVGAPVMSLYRYVENKEELLRLMTDAALGEEPLPTVAPDGWRAQLRLASRAEWRTFRRHPWLARVVNLTRPEPLPNAMRYAEWMFRALGATGADPHTQMRVHVILHGFVQGLAVNVEAEADAASETGLSEAEWMETRQRAFEAIAASGQYPSFARVFAGLGEFEMDLDDLFERGLAALLDGFAKVLDRRGR
jgi:DNA-binding transcriptional regulator YhcF (GntR family)